MECTLSDKVPVSKKYLRSVMNEEPTTKSKALSLWSVCEKDQSVENVMKMCEVFDISYHDAMEWRDYCLALIASDVPLKKSGDSVKRVGDNK